MKQKILNFDYQYFYALTLAYKEFLKLATLSKKQWQSVEPKYIMTLYTLRKLYLPKLIAWEMQ